MICLCYPIWYSRTVVVIRIPRIVPSAPSSMRGWSSRLSLSRTLLAVLGLHRRPRPVCALAVFPRPTLSALACASSPSPGSFPPRSWPASCIVPCIHPCIPGGANPVSYHVPCPPLILLVVNMRWPFTNLEPTLRLSLRHPVLCYFEFVPTHRSSSRARLVRRVPPVYSPYDLFLPFVPRHFNQLRVYPPDDVCVVWLCISPPFAEPAPTYVLPH